MAAPIQPPIVPAPPGRDLLTLALAVWGAIIATATALWNVRRDYKDRASLKVQCYFGPIEYGPGEVIADNAVTVFVTNNGRQPLVVQRVGGRHVTGENREFTVANEYGTCSRHDWRRTSP